MSNLCEICGDSESKYKCPRCLKKTCSLPCTQKHKNQDGCSAELHGLTSYIDNGTLKNADDEKHENNFLVQRDYQFLTRLGRHLEVEIKDGRINNKRTLQQPYGNTNNQNSKRPRYDSDECHRIIRRGVNCILLPRGMERSQVNKSKWDKPLDLFVWTIEWIVYPREEEAQPFTHISHRIRETDTIVEGMGKMVYDKCCEFYQLANGNETVAETKPERTERLIKGGLKFYTKWFPYNTSRVMDSKKLIRLDPCQKAISVLFKDRTVIEFPTLYIVDNESALPKEYTVVDEEAIKEAQKRDEHHQNSDINNEEDSSNDERPREKSSRVKSQESDTDSDGYDPGVTLDFLAG